MKAFIVTLKHVTIDAVEEVSERKLAIEEIMHPGFRDSRYLKYCKEYFDQKGWKQNFFFYSLGQIFILLGSDHGSGLGFIRSTFPGGDTAW